MISVCTHARTHAQAQGPLTIKPLLPVLTKSEIHAVMTGGFATIAGEVMAVYILFGVSTG